MAAMPTTRLLAAAAICTLVSAPAAAQHEHHGGAGKAPPQAPCESSGLACATTATPAFASDGTLWLAWGAKGGVWAARSTDLGRSFAEPVPVTREPLALPLDNGPDARPRIVIGRDGAILVSFATRDAHYNGRAYVARSRDGSAFEPARDLTAESPSQRFETLAVDADGRVFAAWIDKRNAALARKSGSKYAGAALAFSWSDGASAGFAPATIARDNTCECCRIGIAFAGPGRPVVLFRNIFDGGIRDHAVVVFDAPASPGPVRRVSVDDWQTDACPHHGPSLAVSPSGTLHAVWFTNGKSQKGLYYAASRDLGLTFAAARRLGDPGRQASRPFVLAGERATWLAWKEFDGERTRVMAQVSRDDGASWSTPRSVAETSDDSDHPLLIARAGQVYLSWLTRQDGYRLIALSEGT
jgi:hypothetical protein